MRMAAESRTGKRRLVGIGGPGMVAALVALALVAWHGPAALAADDELAPERTEWIAGQLLVAAPRMPDPHFSETVIFIVEHNEDGALGLVINKPMAVGPLGDMMKKLGIGGDDAKGQLRVYYGGPVEMQYAFVLHTTDYNGDHDQLVNERYAMTTRAEILIDMAKGKGPKKSLFALGYAGWGPGQLEAELASRDWIVVPADDDLLFDDDFSTKWDRALARQGVEL